MAGNTDGPPDIEYQFFRNKRPDRIYISKQFQDSRSTPPRKMRIGSRVLESKARSEFVMIRGETVLRTTPGGRQEVKAVYCEDSEEVEQIVIQKFTKDTGRPMKQAFSFTIEEMEKVFEFVQLMGAMKFERKGKIRFDDESLKGILIGEKQKRRFLLANLDLVEELARNKLTKSDVVALGYRKEQLNVFRRLLADKGYFATRQMEWGKKGVEAVWQKFFEDNQWIFGYGLTYIFVSGLANKKLEQVTTGFSVSKAGKRTDALLKTRGRISSLCFAEIKSDDAPLVYHKAYRPSCWRISDELSGAVAQIQKTVQAAVHEIRTKLEIHDELGVPTGEVAFLFQPRSFVVIGNLQQFMSQNGINEQQFASFELFRRNLTNPEVITFDELYERARFIVEQAESEGAERDEQSSDTDDDDILL